MYSAGLLILSSLGTSWQLRADFTTEQPLLRGADAGSDRGTDPCHTLFFPAGWDPRRAPGCLLPSILGAYSKEGSGVSSITPFLLLSSLRMLGYLRYPVGARSPSPSLRVGEGTSPPSGSAWLGWARLGSGLSIRGDSPKSPWRAGGGGQGECGGRSCAEHTAAELTLAGAPRYGFTEPLKS